VGPDIFMALQNLLNAGNYPHKNFNPQHWCCNVKSQKAIFTLSETVISEGEAHISIPAAQCTTARKNVQSTGGRVR